MMMVYVAVVCCVDGKMVYLDVHLDTLTIIN